MKRIKSQKRIHKVQQRRYYPKLLPKRMNDINFAEICWGDYLLDGRIVPYKKFEGELPIVEELNEIIDYYIDEMLQDY